MAYLYEVKGDKKIMLAKKKKSSPNYNFHQMTA